MRLKIGHDTSLHDSALTTVDVGLDQLNDTEYLGKLGYPLTLHCGANLTGNPPPNVIWKNPSGQVVNSNNRYLPFTNGTQESLNISCLTLHDIGVWNCTVESANRGMSVLLQVYLDSKVIIVIHYILT